MTWATWFSRPACRDLDTPCVAAVHTVTAYAPDAGLHIPTWSSSYNGLFVECRPALVDGMICSSGAFGGTSALTWSPTDMWRASWVFFVDSAGPWRPHGPDAQVRGEKGGLSYTAAVGGLCISHDKKSSRLLVGLVGRSSRNMPPAAGLVLRTACRYVHSSSRCFMQLATSGLVRGVQVKEHRYLLKIPSARRSRPALTCNVICVRE
jgi:hypothetical protein